jgi:dTDP-4-dehydrorhamnose 3,5-epimerase
MRFIANEIEGLYEIQGDLNSDNRGTLREGFRASAIEKYFHNSFDVSQLNITKSVCNSIRGIHFSSENHNQHKLVTCVTGEILDVIIDLRKSSRTFGRIAQFKLNENMASSILVPPGVGHSFASLKSSTVIYLLTKEYNPKVEFGINPFDKELNIPWGIPNPIVSLKDSGAPTIAEAARLGLL